ncbi:MAG: hypothetical protein ACM3QU_08055 [Verrucomicrobiota bacterium]
MGATPPESGAPADRERLVAAVRDARDDAAPSALAAAGLLILLALVSKHASWELLGRDLWWIWLVVAAPYICLFGVLAFWRATEAVHDHRRSIVIGLLAIVWTFTVLGVGLLVMSLVSHSGREINGRELLLSGTVVLATNAVAFGLAFWELDCGGPVARAVSNLPRKPDFQFAQDENPQLARDGWSPRLWDYLYVSLTNSIAFSPTDTMPLTRTAKRLMAAESILSGITILLVAARAVNILA